MSEIERLEAEAARAEAAVAAYIRGPWREALERRLQLYTLADFIEQQSNNTNRGN